MAGREFPQILRIVFVSAVAWQLCVLLGAQHPPVYALIVPLVSLRDDPFSAFNVSIGRLVGVVVGLAIAISVVQIVGPGVLAVALVLLISLSVGMAFRIGNVLNLQVGVSALLVFSNADPGSYGLTRLWETGVGTVLTLALAPFLFPANPLRRAESQMAAIAAELSRQLLELLAAPGAHADADALTTAAKAVDVDIETLGRGILSAQRSAPWSVLHRGQLRDVAAMAATHRLAMRISRHLSSFAAEVGYWPVVTGSPTMRT